MNKLYIYLAPILIILFFINTVVFKSYILQYDLISEFNSNNRSSALLEKITSSNLSFPNITITTLPLNALKADYLLSFDDFNNAQLYLNKKINDNPYLFYYESLKSKFFLKTQQLDSARFYGELVLKNLPKNLSSFADLCTIYGANNDLVSLHNVFINHDYSNNIKFWNLYLSTLIIIRDNSNDVLPKTIQVFLKTNYKLFKDDEFKSLIENLILGQNNVDKALEIIKEAELEYNSGNFENAAIKFLESLNYNPYQYSSYENRALALIRLKKYSESLIVFNEISEKFDVITPKTTYFMALNYSKLGMNTEACKYVKIARKSNFKQAFNLTIKDCI